MNENFYIHLLQLLNETFDKKLVYIEKQGFFIKEYYDNEQYYTSLDRLTTLPRKAIENRIYELNDRESIKTLLRSVVAPLSLGGRSVADPLSHGVRFAVGESELSPQDFERIESKYEIFDIADDFQNPYLRQLLREIKILTVEALARAERQRKRRSEILEFWKKARQHAEASEFLKLEELRDRLLSLSGRQLSGVKNTIKRQVTEEFRQEYKKTIKRIKSWSFGLFLFFVSLLFLSVSIRFKHIEQFLYQTVSNTNQAAITTNQTGIRNGAVHTITKSEITKAVSEYNQTVSKANQITNWRKQKIITCLSGKKMTAQALRDSIRKFSNTSYYFWKNCKN